MLDIHWPRRDPQYKGAFNFEFPLVVTIGPGGYTDYNEQMGVVNMIYRLVVATASVNSWRIKLFDKDTFHDDDLAWDSGAQVGAYNSIDEDEKLIVQPDKDGTNELHMRVLGTPGDVLNLTLNLVRMT